MSLPFAPTVTSLITEAYTRCGISAPTDDQLSRATREWFEGVKSDLQGRKDWHTVEETLIVIPAPYVQVYAMPSPLVRVTKVRFYRGTHTGTAQAGGTSTITIAAGQTDTNHRGLKIYLTGGTGLAQSGRIVGVSGALYTMSCPWATVPDTTTTYVIAETEQIVFGPEGTMKLDGVGPSTAYQYWDFYEQNLHFWPPVDNQGQYALEIDGMVDLALVDSQDARIVRLLREWREPIIRGLMVYIKEDQDDLDDADRQERRFDKAAMNVMKRDVRKRLRGEQSAFRSMGGAPRRRRY